jgi:type I restriction enzyme S subunit
MNIPAYPRTKPSGVEWLGDVPEHWEVRQLRRALAESLQYGANEPAEVDDPSLPRYVRITDISEKGDLRDETFRSLPKDVAAPYLLEDGDLLFARSGATSGKTFLYQTSWGICAYAGYLIRARMDRRKALPEFIKYFTSSSAYWQWLSSIYIQSTIQNVSAEKYAGLQLSLPPLPEQRTIVAYLDRETGRINRLITQKQELIERLKEKHNALISFTVTRGLTRALPFKASGVEWLGEIPAHWEAVQLRRKAQIIDCKHRTVPFVDEGIPVVSIREVHGFKVDLTTAKQTTEEEYLALIEGDRRPRLGDIIYSRNATVGDAALVTTPERFCIGQDVCIIRTQTLHPEFLLYLFRSAPLVEQVNSLMIGSTFRRINVGQIHAFWITAPPMPEQVAIAAYLEKETTKLNALVAEVELAIERLKEYRIALITSAVTGKIDVREVAA